MSFTKSSVLLAFCLAAAGSSANAATTRWTGSEDPNADFAHIVDVVNQRTGAGVSTSEFLLFEDTQLATSHFRMYLQTAGNLPIKGRSIRVWTEPTGAALQVEAAVEDGVSSRILHRRLQAANFGLRDEVGFQKRLMAKVRNTVKLSGDPALKSISQKDEWLGTEPARTFRVKANRGEHILSYSLLTGKELTRSYHEYPQSDEFSLPALVFPIYEQTHTGQLQSRVAVRLKRLKTQVPRVEQDPYLPLRYRQYPETMQDAVLGTTPEGQARGYWSEADLKTRAGRIRTSLPLTENSFGNGLILDGKFASVSIDPEAGKFKGLTFQPRPSAQFRPHWSESTGPNGKPVYNLIPGASLLGRPLAFFEDAYTRPARRVPSNDPVEYLNDGFDEIQVYWAIDTLMDTLHGMGFNDPELSTRPFNAFLYNPDVAMKNNAFYTSDTINFTTYSPGNSNAARDNSTIWHELGHGVMDRLMGDALVLNDSGGLSEGMADFIAALIIARVTNGQPFEGQDAFRIVNKTAFFLTNESHDDGEAYGGAMYDFLQLARTQFGEAGVVKVADLTLEAMRLTRDHPALTAPEWFSHMLFADSRGHEGVRAPGELGALILKALGGRNFSLTPADVARFDFQWNGKSIEGEAEGTRAKPVFAKLRPDDKAKFQLTVRAKESSLYSFHYPLKVKLAFHDGSLQGAVHWEGKENGDRFFTLNSAEEELKLDIAATGKCAEVNRPDGSCVDYIFVELFVNGQTRPSGKKRFYVQVSPQAP